MPLLTFSLHRSRDAPHIQEWSRFDTTVKNPIRGRLYDGVAELRVHVHK